MNVVYDLPIAWSSLHTIGHCGWCGIECGMWHCITFNWCAEFTYTDTGGSKFLWNIGTCIFQTTRRHIPDNSKSHSQPRNSYFKSVFCLAKFVFGILSCLGWSTTLFSTGNMAANYGQARAWKQAKVVSFRTVSRDYTVETENTLDSELR